MWNTLSGFPPTAFLQLTFNLLHLPTVLRSTANCLSGNSPINRCCNFWPNKSQLFTTNSWKFLPSRAIKWGKFQHFISSISKVVWMWDLPAQRTCPLTSLHRYNILLVAEVLSSTPGQRRIKISDAADMTSGFSDHWCRWTLLYLTSVIMIILSSCCTADIV